jgi:hypothetical protein
MRPYALMLILQTSASTGDLVEIPREPASLARRLGGFPFWRGEAPFVNLLRAPYAAAFQRGLDVYLGPGDDRNASAQTPEQ